MKAALSLVALALCAPACGGTDTPAASGAAGTGGTGMGTCDASNGTFAITDDTNYTLPSSLQVKTVTVKDGTGLTVDWGSLTQDFYGKPLDPSVDIDLVLISLWKKTPEQLEVALASDRLDPNGNIGLLTTYPTDDSYTSATLLDFNELGNPVPPGELSQYFDTSDPKFAYPSDQFTFLIEASSGTALGKGARMLSFFHLDPSATGTTVSLASDSALVNFSAHLREAKPMRVPANTANLTIDWSQMTLNALGNEYDGSQITEAVVAHFANKTLAELEAEFLDLRTIADGWWAGRVTAGRTIDLSTLVDSSKAPFPGIDANGVWLAALFCTANCNNPAPWSITVLETCGE
jgi:hypothetical protein